MNSYECLRDAARIESLAQEMYAGLALSFADRPYLRQLFAQLSAEEGQHALRIGLLSRHQAKAPWAADALERLSTDLGEMMAEVESMKEEFATSGDAGHVMERIVEMERRFGSIHAEVLARTADPDVQALFTALAKQDARHRALIEGAQARAGQTGQARG